MLRTFDHGRRKSIPSASDALREGMVRIVNHSDESGQVAIMAIDDSGLAFGPVTLEVEAGQDTFDAIDNSGAIGQISILQCPAIYRTFEPAKETRRC